jgi:putative pyruvate formate lyase activating enzyme
LAGTYTGVAMERSRREFALGLALAPGAGPQPRVMRRKEWEPAYLALLKNGELDRRAKALRAVYDSCRLCPRACGVNRNKGEKGVCKTAARVKVASWGPHHGEEKPLSGWRGSGTVFFSNCNLQCVFCQNWQINHRGDGSGASDEEVGRIFLEVQEAGCHNLNLVTPTHIVPNLVAALAWAARRGFSLPVVYNCGGYEGLEAVRLLDGIVDIHLPDYKYPEEGVGRRLANGAAGYPEAAAAAIEEMQRQVGELVVDESGVALRGLIIRHLVLPGNLAGTDKFVRWVAERLGTETWVNLMAQYRPEHRAREFPPLDRRITGAEFEQAIEWARGAKLRHVFT